MTQHRDDIDAIRVIKEGRQEHADIQADRQIDLDRRRDRLRQAIKVIQGADRREEKCLLPFYNHRTGAIKLQLEATL